MEITAVLYFLRNGAKLHFYSLGTIFEENMQVSRGMQSLGSGFPIGARSITYYKLRDLGQALGFHVGWSAEQGVYIETGTR